MSTDLNAGVIIGFEGNFDWTPRATPTRKEAECYHRNTRKGRFRLLDRGDVMNRLAADERFPGNETITREMYYRLQTEWEEQEAAEEATIEVIPVPTDEQAAA